MDAQLEKETENNLKYGGYVVTIGASTRNGSSDIR